MPAERRTGTPDQPLAAVRRLRAAADHLERSGNRELVEIAAAVRRYEREAPLGLSLDDALGLSARGGAGPWWQQERRARRDAMLRDLHRAYFADLGLEQAAAEIAALASVRQSATTPARDERDRLVDEALRTGIKIPAPQRLVEVLGISNAD